MRELRPPHPLMTALAKRRYEQGRSQLDVASELGVSQIALCYWETGKRAPTLASVSALAETLGCELTLIPKESSCDSNST